MARSPSALPSPEGESPDQGAPLTLSGKPDQRHLRGQASAQRIVDATISLIAQEGLSGVTMQSIATRIGSSNALVVFHFGSKDGLFRAVLEALNAQYAALWAEMVTGPDLTAAQKVMASIDCSRAFMRRYPDSVAAWVMFSSDRNTIILDRAISLPADQGYFEQAKGFLREVAVQGGHGDLDLKTLSAALNYLVQGGWYWDSMNPENLDGDCLRNAALLLLRQAFPRDFPDGI